MHATLSSRISRLFMVVFLLSAGLAIPSSKASANVGVTLTVNSNSDADNGGDGHCTLREAITASNDNVSYHECTASGTFLNNVIVFSLSGNTTITLTATLPAITSNLTIYGANAGRPVVIDGAGHFEPFTIYGTLNLENLTVQHGHASAGGAAFNYGTLNVLYSSFMNNVATVEGGAIENITGATVTIVNSTFSGNKAPYGGGLGNNGGTATILNSTFSGNTSLHGGALSTWQGGIVVPVTTVKNSILANSSAPQDCYNGNGGTPTGDHNIIETSGGYGSGCTGITTSSADPKLGALTDSPAYFPLLSKSPALYRGDNATCAAYPVDNTSQNGVTRPQGLKCDIGSYEKRVTKINSSVKSVGAQDGWVLESSENSSTGGSFNSSFTTFRLGDDATNKQYRGVLSFGTGASLPDNAVITKVTLKLKKQSVTGGGNPVTTFLGFMLDIKKGSFGTTALQTTDFQAGASHTYGPFSPASVGGWYSFDLTSGAGFVNKVSTSSGLTQIRLRFNQDDNNDAVANYLSLFSGDAGSTSRPQLVVQYYLP